MFVSFPAVNRALNQHRQHFQVNDAISRDNSFFANCPRCHSPVLFFSLLSHLFSFSLLQCWIGFHHHAGPVIQFLLSSIFSCIFSFSSSLMEGQGPGVDGRRGRSIRSGSRLFSFITFSCSFLGGGNLIRRAISFGGHLSPCHLWKVLLENKSYWQTDRDREWEEMRLHHAYTDERNGWHEEKEERRVVMCVCLQSTAFAALQGVVCHVRLLNLSVALAAFVCSRKVRAILSYEQGFTVSFTSSDCQGHPVDIWNLTHAHRRQSFSLVKLNHV